MVINIHIFLSRLDDSTGEMCKCAFIIAENREWLVFVALVVFIVFDSFA